MSGVSVDIIGMDRLTRRLQKLPAETQKGVKTALISSALLVETSAKKAISQGKKSGKIYKRRGVTHQASAPDEAPATDRGRLVSSISHQELADGLEVAVGTNLKYGRFLEFGTSNIAPRPWLYPSLKQNIKKIVKSIDIAVKIAIGRS